MDPAQLQLRNAQRRTFWRCVPMWKQHAPVTADELLAIAKHAGVTLPEDLAAFLVEFGFGDINDELSFRQDWLAPLTAGQLRGHVVFGEDDRGNLYTFDPNLGTIHYLDRFEPGYCRMAVSFREFLAQAAARNFAIVAWAEGQSLAKYESAA